MPTHSRRTRRETQKPAGGSRRLQYGQGHSPQSGELRVAGAEDMVEGILIARGGVIVWCNPTAEEMFGYGRRELNGQDADFFLPKKAESSDIRDALRGTAKTRKHFKGTTHIKKKDGSLADIEFSLAPVPNKVSPEFVIVTRDVTGRDWARRAPRESMEFETLISDLSAQFINLAGEDMEDKIGEGLRRIVEVLGADRSTLFEFSEDKAKLLVAHSYSKPGTEELPPVDVGELLPWYAQKLRCGEVVRWHSADELPDEAVLEKFYIEQSGFKSHLAVPLTVAGTFSWAIGLGSFTREEPWPRELVPKLRLLGEVFANALARKRAHEALQRSEEHYRALIENAQDVIVVVAADGRVLYESPAVDKILGHRAEEVIGKNGFEFVHPDDMEKMTDIMSHMLRKSRASASTELRAQHKDGSWRTIQVIATNLLDHSAVNGLVVNLRDITERRQAEEALQKARDELEVRVKQRTAELAKINNELQLEIGERKSVETALRHSEEFFRALLDNSLDGIVLLNRDGTIRYKNPTNERLLGYESEERQGGGPFDHIHPDDIPRLANQFGDFVKTPEGTLHAEVRVQHKDGSWRVMEAVGCNLLHNSVLECIVVNMRDITERRHAEEALREREKHFRSLIENSLDGIVIVDRKGVIRYESPSVERIAGYRPEELTGKRIIDYIHPDDTERILAIFKELSRSPGQTVSFESRFKLKNGQWATFEAIQRNLLNDPIVNGYVVNYRDITERKIAEEELRIKENAIENSINAVAMSDMVGTITYVNKACMKLWGNDTKADILGKPYWSLLEPDDMNTAKDIATAMLENQSWEGELRGRRKDGKELYVQVASAIVNDDKGNPIQTISSFIDITERKKAEEALRASEEMFRRFLEEMNDGYCVLEGFTIAFANARCAEMFGYAQNEVIGKSFKELLPPETIEDLSRVHTRRQRGERVPAQYESTLVRKDGTECTVEFGPRIIEYQGKPAVSVVIRDVTQRKQMERALRESEAEFRTIFEEAAIGIALIDMEAKPLEINTAFQGMLGYTLDDLKEMSSFDYLHPEDALADEALFREMIEGSREHYTVEKRLVRKDGQVVWGRQNLSLVHGAEGEPRFMIAMIEDITERKRAEEERQRMEQQLQLTGRLAAVGELAAGVAHELNNPLAAVQAYAQFLATQRQLDDSIKGDVETIYREAQRAARITGNLLSFSRRHKPEKSLVSINDIIEKSIELHAYRMRVNNIEIELDMEPELPRTMADFHQMQQVFVNLITNAEQAMTDANGNGRLTIRTRVARNVIEADFTDNGPGITEEDLKRIFDPFFTTKEVGKGTGLGLSICFGIVQEHGGRIHAESVPNEGTTFVVELPVITQEQTASPQNGTIQR